MRGAGEHFVAMAEFDFASGGDSEITFEAGDEIRYFNSITNRGVIKFTKNINISLKQHIKYRVTHLLANLGLVDFDFVCSTQAWFNLG